MPPWRVIRLFEKNLTMNCGGASVPPTWTGGTPVLPPGRSGVSPDISLMKGGEGGEKMEKGLGESRRQKKVRLRKR